MHLSIHRRRGRIASGIGQAVFAFTISILAASLAHAADAPPVMTIPGQFAVTPTGAATYTIPITVPPGTAGMVPSVSLEYSSQGGDGIVGYGFMLAIGAHSDPMRGQGQKLSDQPQAWMEAQGSPQPVAGGVSGKGQISGGMPAITRCARTLAQDTFHGGVNLDLNDRFCLNGQRLMVISGTYGADGSEYRTEIETFTKVLAHGTAGNGPSWFEVHQRDGLTLEFGNTTDSRIIAVGSATARAWALDKLTDPKGNYFTVAYTNDTTNGQFYPNRIDYTGNAGASLATYNSVQFAYNTSRPDIVPMYQAGSLIKTTVLLTDIKTYQGTNLVHDYKLAYRLGTSVLHSRLTSVTQCDPSNACLAPTTLTWQGGNGLGALTTAPSSGPAGFGEGPSNTNYTVGDFNGDGLIDYTAFNTSIGQACGSIPFGVGTQTPGVFTTGTMTLSSCISTFSVDVGGAGPDFAGNGFAGVAAAGGTIGQLLQNDGNGHFNVTSAPSATLFVAGDFNGDGRADLLSESSSGDPSTAEFIPVLSGNSPPSSGVTSFPAYYNGIVYAATGGVDFSGNGCADIPLTDEQATGNFIHLTCTNTNVPVPGPLPLPGSVASSPFLDANGDGKADYIANGFLYLSTGIGYVQAGAIPSGCGYVAGDFLGNGRDDLLCTTGSTTTIYLSTGTGFVSSGVSYSGTATNNIYGDFGNNGSVGFFDANGNTNYLAFVPELITGISNGIGGTTTLTYDRLNKNSPFYTKCPNNPSSYNCGDTYPTQGFDGPMYVVSQVQSSNGIGGNFTTTYTYGGAKRDLYGRGFLGFQSIAANDNRTGIVTTSNYSLSFPFIGMLTSQTEVTTASSASCTSGVTLKSVTNTPSSVSIGGTRTFAFISQSVVAANDCDGSALPTVTTTYHYDCQDTSNPCYGNPTTITASVSDGSSRTTTNTYTPDTTNWCLSELTQAAVNSVVGSSNLTRTTTYAYTTCWLSQEIVEPSSSTLKVETDYTLDTFGDRTAAMVSGPNFTTRTTHAGFDAKGEFATSTTDALGHVTSFVYDQRFGTVTSQTDPNNLVTSWTFDTFGRETQETRPDGTISKLSYAYCSGVNGGTATCPTNGATQKQAEAFASNGTTQIGPIATTNYDALFRTIAADVQGFDSSTIRTATQYDANGHVSQSSRPYFLSGGTPKYTTFSYDALDRATSTTFPDSSHATYAFHGLTTSVTNDKGQTTTTVRNAQGQVASVKDALDTGDPGHHTTTYVYDAFDDLTNVTDPKGNITTNTYDLRGHKIGTVDPDMGSWTYGYDALGELTSQTDAKSQTVTLGYDFEKRLTSRSEPDLSSNWVYGSSAASHNVDKLVSACTGTGCTTPANSSYFRALTYDSLGRPSTTAITSGASTFTYTTTYNTSNGQIASVSYPSGLTINYAYTALGYLSTLTDPAAGKVYWTANTRDAELHLTGETAGNGVATTQTFDPNTGRLTNVRAGTNNSVAQFDYTFDTIGNLTYRADDLQGFFEYSCYDALNRLTNYADGNTATTCTSSGTGITTKTVGFDALGDITSKSDVGTYTYPAAGQAHPHAVSSIAGTVNGVVNPSYGYDLNGNLTSGAGRTIGMTSYNMIGSITSGTNAVCLAYDSEHSRITQAIGSGSCPSPTSASVTTYLNDPASGVKSEMLVSGATTTWHDYIVTDEKIVAERFCTGAAPCSTGATNRYFTLDHLGSVAVLTDDSGAVVERDSYDAWGRRRNPNGTDNTACAITSQTTRGFTNQEEIDSQCLVNLNARIYDPTIARFMTPDDVVPDQFNTQSLNRFTYVENGPLSYTDPTGHDAVSYEAEHDTEFGGDGEAPGGTGVDLVDTALFMADVLMVAVQPEGPGEAGAAILTAAVRAERTAQTVERAEQAGRAAVKAEQTAASTAERSAAGRTRNPYGSNGKPDHQAEVDKAFKDLQQEAGPGERAEKQTKVRGTDMNRIPDAQIKDPSGNTRKVVEVERNPNSSRSQQKQKEYKEHGIESEVRPIPPQPDPPPPPPQPKSDLSNTGGL